MKVADRTIAMVLTISSMIFVIQDAARSATFKDAFNYRKELPVIDSSDCNLYDQQKTPIRYLKEFLEPNILPIDAKLTYDLTVEKGRISSLTLVSSTTNDPAVRFYCEQALWEGVDRFADEQSFQMKVQFDGKDKNIDAPECIAKYVLAHKNLKDGAVPIHIIPASAYRRFPKAISFSEVYSAANLRAIRIKDLKSPFLRAFRKDWQNYFAEIKRQPSRREFFDVADKLYNRYLPLFIE